MMIKGIGENFGCDVYVYGLDGGDDFMVVSSWASLVKLRG